MYPRVFGAAPKFVIVAMQKPLDPVVPTDTILADETIGAQSVTEVHDAAQVAREQKETRPVLVAAAFPYVAPLLLGV